MRADTDDVHCDSLAGTELGSRALSVPPSLRPQQPAVNLRRAGWAIVGLLVASAVLLVAASREPDPPRSDALRVVGRTLSYSEGFAARAGIRTMAVTESSFLPVVSAVGKADFDAQAVASVDANALGTVRRVVKYEGESVQRGDVLAEIGSPSLARLQASAFLRARHADAPSAAPLGVSLVRSPLEGTVVERRIVTGQSVKGERVVYVIANLDRLSLDLHIDERDARALSVGDRVELAREGGVAASDGHVTQVGDGPSGHGPGPERPVLVRVAVDNRARHLRPGQLVSAKLYASSHARALLIPNRALTWIAGRPAVFVESGHNSVNALPVTLGGCNGDQTEVSVGLAAGQRIVSDGVGTLKEESFL